MIWWALGSLLLGCIEKILLFHDFSTSCSKTEVILLVFCSGLNFSELIQRLGMFSSITVKPPYVPGYECSGIVEELGFGVTEVEVS